MNFFSCELTDVVHNRVFTARSLDFNERELFGCLTFTSLIILHLTAFFLSSLLFILIFGEATHASLLWRCKRAGWFLIEALLLHFLLDNSIHVHKLVLEEVKHRVTETCNDV